MGEEVQNDVQRAEMGSVFRERHQLNHLFQAAWYWREVPCRHEVNKSDVVCCEKPSFVKAVLKDARQEGSSDLAMGEWHGEPPGDRECPCEWGSRWASHNSGECHWKPGLSSPEWGDQEHLRFGVLKLR